MMIVVTLPDSISGCEMTKSLLLQPLDGIRGSLSKIAMVCLLSTRKNGLYIFHLPIIRRILVRASIQVIEPAHFN